MKLDTKNKLSPITITLHWLVGITMLALLASGIYMVEQSAYAIYPWHKAFGFIIFFVVLIRVVWRLKNGWPQPVGQYHAIEHLLAHITHYVLIISTVLMPLSGFIMSAVGGHGVAVFGLEVVARNVDSAGKVLAHDSSVAAIAHNIHHWVGELLIIVVGLHILGALKHHLFDKDHTLKRMLGK